MKDLELNCFKSFFVFIFLAGVFRACKYDNLTKVFKINSVIAFITITHLIKNYFLSIFPSTANTNSATTVLATAVASLP